MNKALFYHSYSRANSFFQNTEYAARGYPDADELALLTPLKKEIPAEVFTQIYRPPVSSGDGFARENLLKADAILNQAGWIVKNQRRVNAQSGKPLRFELLLPPAAAIAGYCPFSTIFSGSASLWTFARSITPSTVTASAAGITT